MRYETTETVTLTSGCGHELELELTCIWLPAEPDVGIMGDYIDDWDIDTVNGSSRHKGWVQKIIDANNLDNAIIEEIYG